MSEDLDQQTDGEPDEDREQVEYEEDKLILFGGLTQTGFMNISVTLWVHGQMISGTMVDQTTYLENIARNFKNAKGNYAGIFSDGITKAVQEERAASDAMTDKSKGIMGDFIYLIDVSIYRSGEWLDLDDVPWKGRVSSIDGFVYGKMG